MECVPWLPHQSTGSLSHYLQALIQLRWCKISAINSIALFDAPQIGNWMIPAQFFSPTWNLLFPASRWPSNSHRHTAQLESPRGRRWISFRSRICWSQSKIESRLYLILNQTPKSSRRIQSYLGFGDLIETPCEKIQNASPAPWETRGCASPGLLAVPMPWKANRKRWTTNLPIYAPCREYLHALGTLLDLLGVHPMVPWHLRWKK